MIGHMKLDAVSKILNRRRVKSNLEAKTVELKSVGTIKMERSRRAKHISVSVRPFKGVRVAVPRCFVC